MKTIVVTGGSGKAGAATIKELVDHHFNVLNVDLVPAANPFCPFLKTDLTELGQVYEVLQGADAVIHLGAIPAGDLQPGEATFRNNTLSTYNVFSAAVALKLQRVVWASSETTTGLPFEREHPAYVPIDENHPLYPESSYALSKVISEEMARQFNRWSGIPFIGLRFSNIMQLHDYARFATYQTDPHLRKWNLWGYVDARDVGISCRLALEADITGAEAFFIAAADTVMDCPSRDLITEVFPHVPIRGDLGEFESLLSSVKAGTMLGYHPQFSWRTASS